MAFESFSWIDWILVFFIFVFLLIIIRNVYRLMKKRNEYVSFKEAQAQYEKQHEENLEYQEKAVDAQFENDEQETDEK
jgi:hypothetical protein